MTLGGVPGLVRCTAAPVAIVREKKAAKDGQRGSMSLCAHCLEVAKKRFGNTITVTTIKGKKS